MKKIVSSLLTVSLLASSIGTIPVTHAETVPSSDKQEQSVTDLSKYETNDVIVVYKKEANATEKKTFSICSLPKDQEENASVDTLTDDSVVLKLDSKDALETAVEALSNDNRVEYVQPNYIYHLTDSNPSSVLTDLEKNSDFKEQWGFYNDGSLTYQEYDYRTGGGSSWFPWNFSTSADTSGFNQYDILTVQAKERVDIHLPEAWEACDTSSQRETVVAFVDTGIKYDHSELINSMWVNEDEIAGDGIDNDGNGFIDDIYGWNFYDESSFSFWGRPSNSTSSENGNNEYYNSKSTTEDAHGTHGAGSVAATNDDTGIAGAASNSNVKIMTVKALGGSEGYGSTESVIKGIQYAEANGATICNLSLGGEEDDATLSSVMKNSKMLFTVAAGNGDSSYNGIDNDSTPTYPACYNYDNVISVANLQCDGTLHYSSNYGAKTVDIAAPGSNVYSTSTAKSGYEYMTGTSMAAPIVAGVAAMLHSNYGLSVTDLKKIIVASAQKMDTLSGKCASEGMLDAYAAVYYAKNGTLPTDDVTPLRSPSPSATPTATPTAKPTRTPATSTPVAPTKSPTATPGSGTTPGTTPTNTPGTGTYPTKPTKPTSTPEPTKDTTTDSPEPTKAPTNTPDTTPAPTNGSASPDITTKEPVNTDSPTPNVTSTPKPDVDFLTIDKFTLSGTSTRYVGKSYTLKATAKGGTGKYQYRFLITKNGTTKAFQSYSTNNTLVFTPSSAGTYLLRVSVKDEKGDYETKSASVTITKFGVSKITTSSKLKKGITVRLKATLNAGVSPYGYTFLITRSGKKVLNKKTTNNYIKWKITKIGTYKVKVSVKDAIGNNASKTTTYKVKK